MSALEFGRGGCSVRGCDGKSSFMVLSGRCQFHETLATARWLTPEMFDRLRVVLAETAPHSDEERAAYRVRSELATLKWRARDLNRSKKAARRAGATSEQITETIRQGKAEVK